LRAQAILPLVAATGAGKGRHDMTTILVRAREPHDVEAIQAIFNCPRVIANTLQLPLRSVEYQRQRFGQPSSDRHSLVAEVEGRVVGVIGLYLLANPRRRHCGDIGMAVHDDFQGQGIGGALLAAALDLADNWLALRRVELSVYTDNAPAIRLYEKFGFTIEGTLRDFAFRDGAYVDAYQMGRLHR
jgi:L-phenylalanine/L-methionine N-acetyltransferase